MYLCNFAYKYWVRYVYIWSADSEKPSTDWPTERLEMPADGKQSANTKLTDVGRQKSSVYTIDKVDRYWPKFPKSTDHVNIPTVHR